MAGWSWGWDSVWRVFGKGLWVVGGVGLDSGQLELWAARGAEQVVFRNIVSIILDYSDCVEGGHLIPEFNYNCNL